MAFMSLTAFADNIVIVPTVIDKTYGASDPGSAYGGYDAETNPNGVKTTMFYVASPDVLPNDASDVPVALTVEDIAKCLKVVRAANYQGENVGSYKYIFQVDLTKRPNFGDHTITVQQNGDLNINKADATITDLTLTGWTYGANANVPTCTAKANTETVPVSYLYANGNDPDADDYEEGQYADIVNGQAGNYYVKATVEETSNYNGKTAYAAFSIGQKAITAPAFAEGPFAITYGESAPDFGLTFTEDDLVNDADADQFEVVEKNQEVLPTAAKGTAYTVWVVDHSGNYSFESAEAEYTINFKAIDADGIAIQNAAALPSKEYKAGAWELTVVDDETDPENVIPAELIVKDGTKRLVSGVDYEVAYANNTNVSENGATITITGIGNYETDATHKLTANFAITPATLHVALATPAQNISYGGDWDDEVVIPDDDWKSDADKAAFDAANLPTATIPEGDDYDEAGKLTAGVEHTVTISGGTAPDNYVFACADDNTVTVGKATITISLKTDATTEDLEWNGTATASDLANALASAYKLSVDLDPEAVFSVQPTVVSTDAAAANYQPGTYAIAFQAHDAVIAAAFADKYTLAWDDAAQTFTITQKALTITALNQAVAKVADAEDSEYNGEAVYGVTYTIDGFADGEDIDDNSLDLTGLALALTDDGVLTTGGITDITPDGAVSAYYDIAYGSATLTVAGAAHMTLTLPFNSEAADLIDAAEGTDVKVKFESKVMKEKEWYAMVLPFDITPAELVKAFDTYVVVNLLNVNESTDQNFKFTLTMDEIEAGTPFLIKPAQEVNWEDFDLGDVEKTIESDVNAVTATKDAQDIVTFDGTYEAFSMQNNKKYADNGADLQERVWWLCDTDYNGKNTWLKPTNKAHTVAPFEAYLIAAEGWSTYAPTITVEDFDGSVTAIKSISADQINGLNVKGMYNLNGMKMNNVPTQKGVYIINGKKVVIK